MFWLGYVLKLAAGMMKSGFRRQGFGFSPLATCVATENTVHTAGAVWGCWSLPRQSLTLPPLKPSPENKCSMGRF